MRECRVSVDNGVTGYPASMVPQTESEFIRRRNDLMRRISTRKALHQPVDRLQAYLHDLVHAELRRELRAHQDAKRVARRHDPRQREIFTGANA